jgi:SHS2 domain-containing protein
VAREGSAGHRMVPHTADLRIEAWAPTAEQCVAEAVRAMVCGFTDVPSAAPTVRREFVVRDGDVEEQLVTVLDEVIYRMDTDGEIPQAVEVRGEGPNLRVALAMADVAQVTVIGAVPKAVSLHQLRFGRDDEGWHCAVTLDV